MEVAGLALSIPPVLVGIRKCIQLLRDLHGKFQDADSQIEEALLKCSILEQALERMNTGYGPDPLLEQIGRSCAQEIKRLKDFLHTVGIATTYPNGFNSLSKTAKFAFIRKDGDLKRLIVRLDNCRANVHIYLDMTQSQTPLSSVQQLVGPKPKEAAGSTEEILEPLSSGYENNDLAINPIALATKLASSNKKDRGSSVPEIGYGINAEASSLHIKERNRNLSLPNIRHDSSILRRFGPLKFIDVAVSSHEGQLKVACLGNDTIHFYGLDALTRAMPIGLGSCDLPRQSGWELVAFSAPHFAALSRKPHKQLYFGIISENELPSGSVYSEDIRLVSSFALSSQGLIALVFREQMRIIGVRNHHPRIVLQPSKRGQKFTQAAFNERGDLLYAYAFGGPQDQSCALESLYIWRVQDGIIGETPATQYHHESDSVGEPKMNLFPYPNGCGCIGVAQHRLCFPMQTENIPPTIDAVQLPWRYQLQSNVTVLPLNRDDFLITMRRKDGIKRTWILEEQCFRSNEAHSLMKARQLCKLKSKVSSLSKVVITGFGANRLAIVCNLDATVEFVQVEDYCS